MIPFIPFQSILSCLRHVTFDAFASIAVGLVMGVLGNGSAKHGLGGILPVTRKAKRVVLAGLYSKRRVSTDISQMT